MSTDRNEQLGTSNVVWNLDDLYPGPASPAFHEDEKRCRTLAEELDQKYSGRVGELGAKEVCALVSSLEDLAVIIGKLSTYAFLNFTTRTKDEAAAALLQRVRELASEVGKHTVFFELEWNQIDAERARRLLADPALDRYRHYLADLRKYAPHQLSREKEELLIEIAPAGRASWTNLFEKVMGHMEFGEGRRTEEEVLADLYSPDRETRRRAAGELTAGLREQLHVLTHIFNTLLTDKMIDDRLRGYATWLDQMNLANELRNETVETLVRAVTGRYDIVQRYYRLKRRLLGLDELYDYDRYAPLPNLPERQVGWEEAREMVLGAMREFSPRMAEVAERFFTDKWIHAPILAGKRGGAFAHPCVPDAHPYVMLNYTGNLRDISTLAHELGHGVHQFLAADQGYFNSSTPLVLAETASVFAELLLFRHQLALLDNKAERRAFVAQKLESIFATVFRQIAMNRFEDAVHNERRRQGELSSERISGMWLETQEAMFAESVTLTEDYGVWWAYIPHFLATPGYVYSYAFGELLVLALYNLYLDDPQGFVPRYLDLLAAGGSASPYELVASFGVDLNDASFWQGGLRVIDDMLRQIE